MDNKVFFVPHTNWESQGSGTNLKTKEIPCLTGKGKPTAETAGAVGCWYMDTDSGTVYKCTAAADGVYTWIDLVNSDELRCIVEAYLQENPPEDGADGGHYTPVITQPTADTMKVEFLPSRAGMAAVEPVEIKLPVGSGNDSGQNAAQDYFLLKSPNGTVYKVIATDAGQLQVVGVEDNPPEDLLTGRLLVWSDDFDGDEIDPEKWLFRLDNPKYYGGENVQVADSILTYPITYDAENDRWRNYYMMTSGLMDAKYGRIEASMKWDIGVYAAWWTVGHVQEKYKGTTRGIIWPRSGECDIFEDAGDGKLFGTIHWGEIEDAGLNQNNIRAYTTTEFDVTQWHRYAVEWTETEYIFYVDDTEVGRADISDIAYEDGTRPFNLPHYFILSAWGNKVTDGNEYYCYTDWVRYYAPAGVTEEIPITGMSLSETAVSLNPNRVKELALTIAPDYCTDYTMRWDSSDRSIATFDGGNRIRTIAEGNCELTVTAKNGITAKCALTVSNDVLNDATDIVLDYGSKNSGYVGETLTITATVTPKWATYLDCDWESSDESIATVADGVVSFVSAGNVTITAKAKDSSGITRSVELVSVAEVPDNINTDGCVAKYTRNGWGDSTWESDIEGNATLETSYSQGAGYYFGNFTSGNMSYTPVDLDTAGDFTIAERVCAKQGRTASGGAIWQIYDSTAVPSGTAVIPGAINCTLDAAGTVSLRYSNPDNTNAISKNGAFDVYGDKLTEGVLTEDVAVNLIFTHTAVGEWAAYLNGELAFSGSDAVTAVAFPNTILCLGAYPGKARQKGDTFLHQALLAYNKALTAEEAAALNTALDEMYA